MVTRSVMSDDSTRRTDLASAQFRPWCAFTDFHTRWRQWAGLDGLCHVPHTVRGGCHRVAVRCTCWHHAPCSVYAALVLLAVQCTREQPRYSSLESRGRVQPKPPHDRTCTDLVTYPHTDTSYVTQYPCDPRAAFSYFFLFFAQSRLTCMRVYRARIPQRVARVRSMVRSVYPTDTPVPAARPGDPTTAEISARTQDHAHDHATSKTTAVITQCGVDERSRVQL